MSVSKTARLDIYIKECSVALISLAEPGSRPPAASGGGGGGSALEVVHFKWSQSSTGASQVHVFPILKLADAGQSSLWIKKACQLAQLQHLIYT